MQNSHFCAQKPGRMKGQLFMPSFAPLPALHRDDSIVSQLSHLPPFLGLFNYFETCSNFLLLHNKLPQT